MNHVTKSTFEILVHTQSIISKDEMCNFSYPVLWRLTPLTLTTVKMRSHFPSLLAIMNLYTPTHSYEPECHKLMEVQAIAGVAGSFSMQPANCR